MSLILEALRKSEAERHQESLPESLGRQQTLLYTSHRKPSVWPVLISLLLIINLAILGYFIYQYSFSQAEDDTPVSISGDSAGVIAAGRVNSVANNELEPVAESRRKNEPASAVKADLSAVRVALVNRLPQQHNNSVRLPLPVATAKPELIEPELAEPELIVPGSQKAIQQEKSGSEDQSDAVSHSPQAEESSVPHINELERSFLKTVPRLVFNSHIYSAAPGGSRIMINNNYLREGQGFSGISVVKITEDGVILEKQARQFKVPVVRDWSPER